MCSEHTDHPEFNGAADEHNEVQQESGDDVEALRKENDESVLESEPNQCSISLETSDQSVTEKNQPNDDNDEESNKSFTDL